MAVSLSTLLLSRKYTDAANERLLQGLSEGIEGLKEVYYGTTQEWNNEQALVPAAGAVYVYSDYQTLTDQNNNITYYPNIKIGDGATLLSQLPFLTAGSVSSFSIDDYIDRIEELLTARGRLVSDEDRERWDQIGNVNAILQVI